MLFALSDPGQFQSLFFWNHYLDSDVHSESPVAIKFQSLFFWNHYLDVDVELLLQLLKSVSILVFLEPLLRLDGQEYGYIKNFCFNPCFSGTTTQTFQDEYYENQNAVSILVFLEPLLRPYTFKISLFRFSLFQSLFFWNHYLDQPDSPGGISAFGRFQSLFFWNHYLDVLLPSLVAAVQKCFNPCFSGTTTQTWLDMLLYLTIGEFQSLFFWNHYLDLHKAQRCFGMYHQFQSLFFWNHYLDFGHSMSQFLISLFQSLFFWNHYLDISEARRIALTIGRFNPCFSGTTTQTTISASKFFRGMLFQSLFFWNHYLDSTSAAPSPLFLQFQSLFFWNHYLDPFFFLAQI